MIWLTARAHAQHGSGRIGSHGSPGPGAFAEGIAAHRQLDLVGVHGVLQRTAGRCGEKSPQAIS
jgi:hypothetical protein